MRNDESFVKRLESIYRVSVSQAAWPMEDWKGAVAEQASSGEKITEPLKCLKQDGRTFFLASIVNKQANVIILDTDQLTEKEQGLIEWMIESADNKQEPVHSSNSDAERKALVLRDWLRDQQQYGFRKAELPEAIVSSLSLYTKVIPLLLSVDLSVSGKGHYSEFKKLLESFFEAAIVLIPLSEKEWLILAPEKILSMDIGEDKDIYEEERIEDKLSALSLGLHEMLETEWVGESHLAVHYPMLPVTELYSSLLRLKEMIMIGRTYAIGSNTHLPWLLQLEKLVHNIPETDKQDFLDSVLKRTEASLDAEIMLTLEHFFALDCNVSETAKKLYIHRNTLLYRLDKFKQETGLDVRHFHDAVLVRISMLLYKVTKRK